MAEHMGIVIKTESVKYARVVTDRKDACGGCQSTTGGCRGCLVSAKIESRVANPVRAGVGDLVKVHLSSANLFTATAILYLLPILGLMVGAFSGVWVSERFGLIEAFGSIVGAITGSHEMTNMKKTGHAVQNMSEAHDNDRQGKKYAKDYRLLASDVSSGKVLIADGMDPSRPWPPYAPARPFFQGHQQSGG